MIISVLSLLSRERQIFSTWQSTLRPPEVCIIHLKREFIWGLWGLMIFIPRQWPRKSSRFILHCNFRYQLALIVTELCTERATPWLRFGTNKVENGYVLRRQQRFSAS